MLHKMSLWQRWDPYVKLTVKLTSPLKLWRARSRLYRRRFLQPNTHFSAFFEIYKIYNLCTILNSKFADFFAKNCKFSLIFRIFAIFLVKSARIGDFLPNFSWNFVGIAGNIRSFPEIQKICRNLQNYLLQLPKIW